MGGKLVILNSKVPCTWPLCSAPAAWIRYKDSDPSDDGTIHPIEYGKRGYKLPIIKLVLNDIRTLQPRPRVRATSDRGNQVDIAPIDIHTNEHELGGRLISFLFRGF